ncbi:undecaprenyldiphospho-muramoylpentapeptide beta-N-acetylglucosaminyltransferase [Actinomycetaceae bacterium TAE3-ERU4]|nr:undecaprenyldiphospho-muramoylpentapeptide beta-N-acetylglucosaminyltransferase [Actinomycetaceae bacterium TAE3-ERU4]
MKILLAGGGTAGHVNPLIATATKLIERGHQVLCLGTETGLEAELIPAQGLSIRYIEKVAFPRSAHPRGLLFPWRFRQAIKDTGKIIDDFGAQVVVGFGGYVSTPAYLAARKRKLPVIIHEQNMMPGLANRWGARFAALLALTFENTPLRAKQGATQVVGLPLRAPIASLAKERRAGQKARLREISASKFGFDPMRPILLVTGGSLGAKRLNDGFIEAMPELPDDLQVYHLTGKGKSKEVLAACQAAGRERYIVSEYSMEMEELLAMADLVVCRSGAGTVCEMSALGLPAIYVPYAVGNGEQRLNAEGIVEAGGAYLVSDDNFSASTIKEIVLPLLADSQLLEATAAKALECGRIEAAEDFCELIERHHNG